MFFKIGAFSYKSRWLIVGIWTFVVIMSAIFAPQVTNVLKGGGVSLTDSDAIRVGEEMATRFGGSRTYLFAVYTAPDGTFADEPAYAQKIDQSVAGLRDNKDVKQILTFAGTKAPQFISTNRKYTYALIGLNIDYDTAQTRLADYNKGINTDGLDMKLTGLPVFYEALNTVSQHDAEKAETYAFPLALIILLLVFRTLVAALMPLMMAAVSVITTLMLVFFIGQVIDVSFFVLNIATLLGLGIGIDYALLVVNRFREELYKHDGNVEQAVTIMAGTSGKAVFFSGLTVMIAMGSLLLSEFSMLRSVGMGGMLVVAVNVVAALTLLPATLGLLGKRINALKVPGLKSIDQKLAQAQTSSGFWHKVAERVAKQPVLIMLGVLAFLLVIGSPFLHIRYGEPTHQILPVTEPSRQGADILEQNFPTYSRSSDVFLLLKARNGLMTDPANSAALYDYATKLKSDFPQIKQVLAGGQDLFKARKEEIQQLLSVYAKTPAFLGKDIQTYVAGIVNGDAATLQLTTNIVYSSQAATDFITSLRAFQPAELSILVGGEQAGLMDFVDVLYADFPFAIALVVVITYIVLFILFQSVILPLKAVIMTGLSLTASYGALVWVFQDGNFADLIQVQQLGYVEATLPILLFSILFGLSMDYEVFMLSRIKEHYDETGDNSKSVAIGLERTGGMITSAALVMVVVAGAFVTADIIVIKAIGFGMALAVALDATIVRALLVPATMELLGKANWWAPRFVRRILPKLSVE